MKIHFLTEVEFSFYGFLHLRSWNYWTNFNMLIDTNMKNLSFLLCFFFISVFAFPQWKWQNPLPQGNGLYSVYFTSVNTGYAVGLSGTILKTVDGGTTWTTYSSGPINWLTSVYFTDANTGYIAGEGETGELILKTNDAGTTWNTIYSGSTDALFSICFPNVNTGYAVGGYGIILKTINAGSTWTTLTSGTTAELSSVFFTDDNTGYAVGYNGNNGKGTIIKTINGGTTWDTLSSGTTHPLNSVFFTDANTWLCLWNEWCSIKNDQCRYNMDS
jgi:photosystem II stability/assembly factor-like uncharacterized protein